MTIDSTFTILIADDHPLFRKGFLSIFASTPYASSRFLEAANGKQAVELAEREDIDVIFLDENMPELNGFDAAKLILRRKPQSRIIVLTQYDDAPLILNYFKLGAKGFLSKDIDADLILEAVHSVLEGNLYYYSKFAKVIESWLFRGLRNNIPNIRFTEREVQVVAYLSRGKTSREISDLMELSTRSVEAYRFDLISKAGI